MESVQEKYEYAAFGSRLKEARENAGFTQSQACEAVGIPKAQVLSSYERGVSSPSIETLAALARVYNVSTDNLVFGDDKPRQRMTTGDRLFLLVCAIDNLGFVPEPIIEEFPYSLKYQATGVLLWGEDSVYKEFFDKWEKLRNAWLDRLIDYEDYYHLVRRHANQVPDDPGFKNLFNCIERLGELQSGEESATTPSHHQGVVSRLISLISDQYKK